MPASYQRRELYGRNVSVEGFKESRLQSIRRLEAFQPGVQVGRALYPGLPAWMMSKPDPWRP